MPIPSLLQKTFDEGREEGREDTLASLVRRRFGDDERIPALVRTLARLDPAGD